jgi:hypothetical protein
VATTKDLDWFKATIAHVLESYQLEYKYYEEGDFGSLNQVSINSATLGGNVDFWGLGWVGIFVWDYQAESENINVLLEPHK